MMNDLRLDPNEWFDDPPIPGDDEDYITDAVSYTHLTLPTKA